MYTGKVSVNGPADVHELATLIISKLAVGEMNNNTYLLRCRTTGAQLLIDAAAQADRILELIGPTGLDAVVTTHQHADHWGALADVVAATGATTYAGTHDADGIPVSTGVRVNDGDLIIFGDITLRAIHLTGHTPGSIALLFDDPDGPPHLFTGDCLFPGGTGKVTTDADFEVLFQGVKSKLFDRLPDETWVYPGHGYDTTIGAERPSLSEWYERRW